MRDLGREGEPLADVPASKSRVRGGRDDGVKEDAGKAQPVRRVALRELVERVEHELRARGRAGRVDQDVARHAIR